MEEILSEDFLLDEREDVPQNDDLKQLLQDANTKVYIVYNVWGLRGDFTINQNIFAKTRNKKLEIYLMLFVSGVSSWRPVEFGSVGNKVSSFLLLMINNK